MPLSLDALTADMLVSGIYKYVITTEGTVRFADHESGTQHTNLLDKGEVAKNAGSIALMPDGAWYFINATSGTLDIDGDKAQDAALLACELGRNPSVVMP